jgi:transposase
LQERVAGLDVHKDSVVACVLLGPPSGPTEKHTRTFGTTTGALLSMRDWLEEHKVQVVVMEATGVYWRPVFNVLQHDAPEADGAEGMRLILSNPQQIKNLPGRKTDVMDAEWIATLARHGLAPASMVPPRPIRELRDLVRYRTKLVANLASEKNRIQKVLEDANIKLGSVASNVLGKSARAMLDDIVRGNDDGASLVQHARGKLRSKRDALIAALEGRPTKAHRFLLRKSLEHIDYLQTSIDEVEAELAARLAEQQSKVKLLCTIPGVNVTIATAVLAELGTNMDVFPSERHLASWAGLCPGHFESAGKKKSARMREGRTWLKYVLCEAAWGAVRTKGCYLSAKYYALRARRGSQRAIMAVAHKIVVAAYWILRTGEGFRDLGGDYLDKLHVERRTQGLIKALEALGHKVSLASASVTDEATPNLEVLAPT